MNRKTAILSFGIILITLYSALGQSIDLNKKVPTDTSVHIGFLQNGIKYYIKRNIKPEKRMELRLAINAGSILEDTDQLGLAHFTEHMAFNGTEHFAKNELVSYLQSVGVRFGADLNAYTSFDETVYMLMLPTDKPELVNKGFQVLEDWAHGITFDSMEIEKERGVVIEEWRLGRGADQRMRDKYLPVLLFKSIYGERLPIGNKENLESFKRKSIIRFYKDWYRTDLMSVIAVGDFNVKEVEEQIKEHFSHIPKTENPRSRPVFTLPSHKQTLISINSDKEAPVTTITVFNKTPKPDVSTIGAFGKSLNGVLFTNMLNQRLGELTNLPSPPFVNAYVFYGDIWSRTTSFYLSAALVSDTGVLGGLKSLLIENEKVKKFGFTESEFERAKKNLLNTYEEYYNERDKTESADFASEIARNFLTDEPMPGRVFEYNFVKSYLPNVKLDDINKLASNWVTDSNRVVVVTAPEKAGIKLPTEADIQNVIDEVYKQDIIAYTDKLASSELLKDIPNPGKVIKKQEITSINTTEIKLSNGVKVLLKPTDFKNEEILVSAISPGGHFLYQDSDHYSAIFCTQVVDECGVGQFSGVDLQKVMAGKTVAVTPYIGNYTEGIKASCAPKDLTAMFQLLYLYFTSPRYDETIYESWKNRIQAYLKNVESSPRVYYSDQLAKIMSQNHPRGGGVPKPEDIDKVNLNTLLAIYKDRFSDASDFTFEIVGSFKTDSIIPFLETYIGSLPSLNRKETWKDLGIRPPKGRVYKDLFKGSDPKSSVSIIYTGPASYNDQENYNITSLIDLLNIRLIEVLREEKSGVYGIGANGSLGRIPYNNYNISIRFPCAPSNVDSLVMQAISVVDEIKKSGCSEENIKKIKETQEREIEVSLKTNSYWLSFIEDTQFNNDDFSRIMKKKEQINTLKASDIQEVAKKYLGNEFIKVVLYPEKAQ